MTPTARTLKFFREHGYTCEVVERWIPGAGVRKDFLSCIDILLMKKGKRKIIGIQCFSTAWQDHHRKICRDYPDGAKLWLSLKRTELWFVGWRKLKVKRGGLAIRYVPRFGQVKLKKGKPTLIECDITKTNWSK